MGIQATNPSTQYLARTTNVPNYYGLTVCCWARIDTDTNYYATVWQIGKDNNNYASLETLVDGTTMATWLGVTALSMVNMTVGSWYFLAMSISNTGVINAYWATPGSSLSVAQTGGPLGLTAPDKNHVFTDVYVGGEHFQGSIYSLKVWTAVLSQNEIAREMNRCMPYRTANLHGWYPFLDSSTGLTDYSGNGNNFAQGSTGSILTTNNPGVTWAGRRYALGLQAIGQGGPNVPLTNVYRSALQAPPIQPVRKSLSKNVSSILARTLGPEFSVLTSFINDLQSVVGEVQNRKVVEPTNIEKDNLPKHGAASPLTGGQFIRLESFGPGQVVEVRHGLGRVPIGGIFVLQSSFNIVMIEGDQNSSPPVPPADKDRVFVKMAGPAGEKAVLLLL